SPTPPPKKRRFCARAGVAIHRMARPITNKLPRRIDDPSADAHDYIGGKFSGTDYSFVRGVSVRPWRAVKPLSPRADKGEKPASRFSNRRGKTPWLAPRRP